jgi:hypothetical protein
MTVSGRQCSTSMLFGLSVILARCYILVITTPTVRATAPIMTAVGNAVLALTRR